jgi:hypothetical protein
VHKYSSTFSTFEGIKELGSAFIVSGVNLCGILGNHSSSRRFHLYGERQQDRKNVESQMLVVQFGAFWTQN